MLRKRQNTEPEAAPDTLEAEIRALRQAVDRLNGHAWVRIENSTPRLLFRQLLKGLALGLGTVVGASVLVSVTIYFLSQINFIPIIGEWANEVADVIEAEVDARRGPGDGAEANEDGSINPDGDGAPDEETAPAEETAPDAQ